MTRRRLTWNDRKASAPPAMPGYQEPSNHPAAYPDPEADAYENGDTSSWAEDPTKGPYPNSFHPALPGTEETQGHPATDPKHYFPAGVTKQAALQLRKAAELKAAKCIRISQAMLGKKASVQAIEDQALDLMSLNERQIQAALKRVADGMTGADLMAVDNMTLTPPREACGETAEEKMLAEMMAGEEPEADEEKMLAAMLAELKAEEAPKAEEQMLAEMLADEGTTDADEALLAQIMAEEQKKCAARKRAGEDQNDPDTYKSEEDPKAGKKSEEEPKADEATKKAAHYKRMAAYWAKVAAEEPKEGDEDSEADEDEPKAAKKADEGKADEEPKAAKKSEEKAEEDPKKADEEKAEEDPKAGKKSAAKKLIAGLNLSDEVKAELAALLADEAPPVEEAPKAEEVPPAEEPVACGEPMSDDFLMDDMGMDDPLMDVPVDDELAILYGGKLAAEEPKADEDEPKADEDEPKADEKKSGKTAAVKPQPRKPSTGAKTIGSVSKTASSEMDDLSKLWASAPDVSKIFG